LSRSEHAQGEVESVRVHRLLDDKAVHMSSADHAARLTDHPSLQEQVASLTMDQITFGVKPLPQLRPALRFFRSSGDVTLAAD